MKWENKKDQREKYCAVHNVDCPYHGDNKVDVLVVKPNSTPSSWICPKGVEEIGEHSKKASRKK